MPPVAPASARDLDDYRQRADRFIATLDEEYYLHFAGHKERLELEAIYAEFADLTTIEQARSIGAAVNGSSGIRELWRFACEGYLGQLTTELEEKLAQAEAELKTTVDGEEIPFRMIKPTIMNEADRGKRERLERLRNELVDEHLNPLYLESHQRVRDAVRRAGRRQLLRALQELRLRPRGARRPVPRVPVVDRAAAHEARGQALPRPRRHAALRGRALGQGPHDARDDLGRRLPCRPNAARAPRDAQGPRRRPRRSGERAPRRREPAAEGPARVLRADRGAGQGDARDQAHRRRRRLERALPRGRPCRALRAHVVVALGRGEAARGQRRHRGLGDAARAPDRRRRVALEDARLPQAARVRGRRVGDPALLRPPLLREAPLRDRVPPGRRPAGDAVPLRRAPGGRAEDHPGATGLPLGHGRALLRERLPPGVGARVAALQRSCRRSSGATGTRSARPARSCASCGPRVSA